MICRRHKYPLIIAIVVGCLLLLIALAGNALGVIIVAIVVVVPQYIRYKCDYIELTDTAIKGHVGFIKSKTLTTPIGKVQNIGISNGLFGKILGYHTITLSDAGTAGTEYTFKAMAHAKEFVDAVLAAQSRLN